MNSIVKLKANILLQIISRFRLLQSRIWKKAFSLFKKQNKTKQKAKKTIQHQNPKILAAAFPKFLPQPVGKS